MPNDKLDQQIIAAQQNEITEHMIYSKLARMVKDQVNSKILQQISQEELGHYNFWKSYTKQDLKPQIWKVWKYFLISKIFGLTFGIKLMERGEAKAQISYGEIAKKLPEAKCVAEDEDRHEQKLINMLDEEKLHYVGSIVLGLNDALVELTGALAGLTLAFQNTRLIALAGLVTGIAASFSMAASEYLSTKSEQGEKHPLKASVYTGITYILTVILLILPYFLLSNYLVCLSVTILVAIFIIFIFNFYVSVAQDLNFKRQFLEMAAISLGVAALSFGIGYLVRAVWGIEV